MYADLFSCQPFDAVGKAKSSLRRRKGRKRSSEFGESRRRARQAVIVMGFREVNENRSTDKSCLYCRSVLVLPLCQTANQTRFQSLNQHHQCSTPRYLIGRDPGLSVSEAHGVRLSAERQCCFPVPSESVWFSHFSEMRDAV